MTAAVMPHASSTSQKRPAVVKTEQSLNPRARIVENGTTNFVSSAERFVEVPRQCLPKPWSDGMKLASAPLSAALFFVSPIAHVAAAPSAHFPIVTHYSEFIQVQGESHTRPGMERGNRRGGPAMNRTHRRRGPAVSRDDRSRHFSPGARYRNAPAGWRRYGARPGDWRTRGCVMVGPLWFCP